MSRRPLAVCVISVLLALVPVLGRPALAAAEQLALNRRQGSPVQAGRDQQSRPAPTAPSAPPFQIQEREQDGGEEGPATASAQADPLVSNGLGSPTCTGGLGRELTETAERNCETSGFVAAAAPTGDYGIDVHIDTGLLGVGSNTVTTVVQDFLVTPLWMALVWVVHALIVMLEWCFSIDLLRGSGVVGLASGLRAMQASFTEPWLVFALACAAVLAAFQGLIRRRVAQALGETVLMTAMMAAGLWVISDPLGTVGALGEWAGQASLGTLAVVASGSPDAPSRRLGSNLGMLFGAAIEAPWCYLEFGDVGWCREPARLDPRLRAAALEIASNETRQAACSPGASMCMRDPSASQKLLEHSALLLRDARSNGELFLALPANGLARNSINEQGSLLRALCQSDDATNCRGPTAAEAEFRTQSGTWARLGGLLLIAGGLLGMLLLVGFLAVRLLVAAVLSLLFVLLAPAVVIAPAFGDAGRQLFRKWAARLLAAVTSKLLFSFLLGAVLAVLRLLIGLVALGWWTQWLLMSAFWWAAYVRRHQLLILGRGDRSGGTVSGPQGPRRSLARRVGTALETPRAAIAATRWAHSKLTKPAPEVRERQWRRPREGAVGDDTDPRVEQVLGQVHHDAHQLVARAGTREPPLAAGPARLTRLEQERTRALAAGDSRRAAELGDRGARLEKELGDEERAIESARTLVREAERTARRSGSPYSREQREAQRRFLDAQAALPAAGAAKNAHQRRDYAALAGLAGLSHEAYEQLDPLTQRRARLQIDRELALRRELAQTARTGRTGSREGAVPAGLAPGGGSGAPAGSSGVRGGTGSASGAVRESPRVEGGSPADMTRRGSREEPAGSPSSRSSVMEDAFAVAHRRKRQLGRDRD